MSRLENAAAEEFQRTLRQAEDGRPLVEPTPEEARNGWTAEALTQYLAEQEASAELRVDPNASMRKWQRKPRRQNSKYNPLRWRR